MPTPGELRRRAQKLLRLADAQEALSKKSARALTKSQLTRVHSESIVTEMLEFFPRRPGPELRNDGPLATVAKARRISLRALAGAIKENYRSVKTWDQRGRVPERVQKKIDALAPVETVQDE